MAAGLDWEDERLTMGGTITFRAFEDIFVFDELKDRLCFYEVSKYRRCAIEGFPNPR